MLGNVFARQGFRLARRTGCKGLHSASISVIGLPRWVAMARKGRKRRERSREERQEEGVDLDSTNELMGQMEQPFDLDAFLADEQAVTALRNRLLSEMRASQGADATATAAAAPPPSRGRAFDSDEYDLSALDNGNETESIDEIAQEAAHKLAVESSDIAEHIIAEHQHDHMIDYVAGRRSSSSSSSSKGSKFGVNWPLGGDKDSSSSSSSGKGAAAQQQRNGAAAASSVADKQAGSSSQGHSKTSSSSSSDKQAARGGGKQGNGSSGSSSSSSGSSRGGSRGSSSSSSSASSRLTGDTAIGRVAESKPGVAVVVLKKGKARLFEAGSPMVYSGAVDSVIGRPPPAAGDVVVVADHNMQPIAWGVFNPVSMFRVRILQIESEALADDSAVLDVAALVELRVQQSVALRATLGLPSEATNALRLLNSEGDRLSGVIADVLGEVVVVQSCAAWSERYRDVITDSLLRNTRCSRVVWRPAVGILKEEGVELSEVQDDLPTSSTENSLGSSPMSSHSEEVTPAAAAEVTPAGSDTAEQQQQHRHSRREQMLQDAVQVHEAGVTFLATPESGQKTGFYADQRHNRAFIASMAAGKTVLDLCCYSGGFGIMAAAAGAAAVTGVDSSASAVELATANAELNGLTDRCCFVRDDVATFLRAALEAGQGWDIVILDPPKLAPNRSSLPRASHKYRRLNSLALGVVRSGGLLMTCSCSGAMTQSGGLTKVVQDAAADAERQVTLLSKSGAAPDHPLHPAYPEGEYLTALTYRVV